MRPGAASPSQPQKESPATTQFVLLCYKGPTKRILSSKLGIAYKENYKGIMGQLGKGATFYSVQGVVMEALSEKPGVGRYGGASNMEIIKKHS